MWYVIFFYQITEYVCVQMDKNMNAYNEIIRQPPNVKWVCVLWDVPLLSHKPDTDFSTTVLDPCEK
jgi:hypothetical protein